MSRDFEIVKIEIIPCRLPLREPFVIAYARQDDVPTVLVRVTTKGGLTGWGEATPDPNVTGESYHATTAVLQHELAPAMLGQDARDRESAVITMDARVDAVPAAKAALDIALHDLVSRAYGLPLWALIGGRSKPHLHVSRVVSIKAPEAMAADALQHVADGFTTIKLKVGDPADWRLDVARIAAVRAAVGCDVKIKIDVNQGWKTAANAIPAIRAALASAPEYIEQPVDQHDIEALAEVRRQTGAAIMADECCHGPRDMQRIVALRAADLVNIKLMKTGGIVNALKTNAIAEAAGIAAQIGTMVESSIGSAAGLHVTTAMANVRTVEMGGPLMLTDDVGNLRDWYETDRITIPDAPGLGVEIDEASIKRLSDAWLTIQS